MQEFLLLSYEESTTNELCINSLFIIIKTKHNGPPHPPFQTPTLSSHSYGDKHKMSPNSFSCQLVVNSSLTNSRIFIAYLRTYASQLHKCQTTLQSPVSKVSQIAGSRRHVVILSERPGHDVTFPSPDGCSTILEA